MSFVSRVTNLFNGDVEKAKAKAEADLAVMTSVVNKMGLRLDALKTKVSTAASAAESTAVAAFNAAAPEVKAAAAQAADEVVKAVLASLAENL